MKELTLIAYHIVLGLLVAYNLVKFLFPFKYVKLEKTSKNIWIIMMIFIAVFEITKCIPLYKIYYYFSKPTTKEWIMENADDIKMEGYKPGKDIAEIHDLDEIEENNKEYFTFTAKKLKATGLYSIKMKSLGGDFTQTYYHRNRGGIKSKISFTRPYWSRNLLYVFLEKNSYSQYYIATLEDDSKIIILLNDELVPVLSKKNVSLPIGIVATPYDVEEEGDFNTFFSENKEKFELLEDNITWYVDMDNANEMKKVNVFTIIKLVITIIIYIVMIQLLHIKKSHI